MGGTPTRTQRILNSRFLITFFGLNYEDIGQIYYDDELVFDVADSIQQHRRHYNFSRWNQFKLVSKYSNGIDLDLMIVGQNGGDGKSVVLLDDIVITVRTRNITL